MSVTSQLPDITRWKNSGQNANGQSVFISPAAQERFAVMNDPRFSEWEIEDVELARATGRETLPWTYDLGYSLVGHMIERWQDRLISQEYGARLSAFIKRSVAARKGWATRR